MKQLDVTASVDNLDTVQGFIEEQLESAECSPRVMMQITLAVEEIFVNIAHYAYSPKTGPATVRVEVTPDGTSVIITFIDQGVPYDPLAKADPDLTIPADERGIGGLGIFLVKKNMDDIKYEYLNGSNILTITKDLKS